jgi:hypothetical protein
MPRIRRYPVKLTIRIAESTNQNMVAQADQEQIDPAVLARKTLEEKFDLPDPEDSEDPNAQ